jgi:hypothetical protein
MSQYFLAYVLLQTEKLSMLAKADRVSLSIHSAKKQWKAKLKAT